MSIFSSSSSSLFPLHHIFLPWFSTPPSSQLSSKGSAKQVPQDLCEFFTRKAIQTITWNKVVVWAWKAHVFHLSHLSSACGKWIQLLKQKLLSSALFFSLLLHVLLAWHSKASNQTKKPQSFSYFSTGRVNSTTIPTVKVGQRKRIKESFVLSSYKSLP